MQTRVASVKTDGTRAEFAFVCAAFVVTGSISGLYKAGDLQGVDLNAWIWGTLYVLCIARLYAMRANFALLASKTRLLLAFCGLMVVSTLWSVEPKVTFLNSVELFGSTLIGYYLVLTFELTTFLKIVLWKYTILAVISLALIFLAPGHGRDDWGGGAWSGIFPDKNALGAAMGLALVTLIAYTPRSTMSRFGVPLVACLFAALLVGSNSATALGSCIGASLFAISALLWRSERSAAFAKPLTAVGALCLAALILLFEITPSSIAAAFGRNPNLTGRTDFWPFVQQAIADKPVLGFGYDAFFRSDAGVQYLSTYVVQAGGWSPVHAHNSFFQIALDAGYAGVVLFAFVLAKAIVSVVRFLEGTGRSRIWPVSILVFLLLMSSTESAFAMYNTDEWIFFVAAMLYPIRYRFAR